MKRWWRYIGYNSIRVLHGISICNIVNISASNNSIIINRSAKLALYSVLFTSRSHHTYIHSIPIGHSLHRCVLNHGQSSVWVSDWSRRSAFDRLIIARCISILTLSRHRYASCSTGLSLTHYFLFFQLCYTLRNPRF